MITKMKRLLNRFNRTSTAPAPRTSTAHGTSHPSSSPAVAPAIKKLQELSAEVSATEAGYDKALNAKQAEYYTASEAFEDAYTSKELTTKRLEEAVRDLGNELDEIQRFKVEDMTALLSEMVLLQPEYLKAKANEAVARASELNHMKQVYQQKFQVFNAGCAEVFEDERFMNHYFQQYGIQTSDNMGDVFASLVKEVPSSFD